MASRMFFAGRLYTSPAVASQVDDTEMAPRNAASGNNIAIVGMSDAGKPNEVVTFQNPLEVKRALRGGLGMVACQKAFAASAQLGGPRTVSFVRVGTATQSTLALKNASASTVINLTSEIYGVPANQIRVKIETGTIRGKKLTTQLGTEYYTADNVARGGFTARYSGSDAAATVDVTATQVILKSGAVGSLVVKATIELENLVVQQVCDQINTITGWLATAAGGSELKPTLAAFDTATAADAKTANLEVRMDLQAVIDWYNSNAEGYVTATRAAGAGAVPANIGFTYLTGATNPVPVVEDWTNAIAALQAADVQWIVPLSGNAAIHAAVDAHCIFMSGAGAKERRAFVGPEVGATKADVKAAALAINSDRTGMVYPGHLDFDGNGNRVTYGSYMSAVLVAAGFAGVNPGTPLTNKTLRMIGLETELRNPVDTDELIDAGVCAIEKTPDGYKVVRSISTWLANDNYNRVEMSCGAATDFVVRIVREALGVLLGEKATPASMTRAVAIAESRLAYLARPEPAGPGVIVGDAKSPAYTKPIAELDGDIINVRFQCSPVVPLNFVQLGVSIKPYAGTTAVA